MTRLRRNTALKEIVSVFVHDIEERKSYEEVATRAAEEKQTPDPALRDQERGSNEEWGLTRKVELNFEAEPTAAKRRSYLRGYGRSGALEYREVFTHCSRLVVRRLVYAAVLWGVLELRDVSFT